MTGWTPADVIAAGREVREWLQFTGIIVVVITMMFMRKDMNGRFSQIIDLMGRVVGAPPDQRTHDEPVDAERRSKNK